MSNVDLIRTLVADLRAPIFLARMQKGRRGETVTLHTIETSAAADLRKRVPDLFKAAGITARPSIVLHGARALRRCRSLESLTKAFGSGEIVYDPALIAARSESVVKLASRIRRAIAHPVDGIFIDANRRTVFAVLGKEAPGNDSSSRLLVRAEALKATVEAVRDWQSADQPGFDLAVRIGFEPPVGARLIAVDAATVTRTLTGLFQRRLPRKAMAATLASIYGLGVLVPAYAAEPLPPPVYIPPPPPAGSDPAVAAPNVSILARGAWLNGGNFTDDVWAAGGIKITLPLGHSFGVQAEAAIGTQDYWGVAGHLFWRDPDIGLIGALASFESMNGSDMTRFAAEGQLYLKNITVNGVVGHQDGYAGANGLYGILDVTFYATPNFAITAGGEFTPERNLAHVGFEWQPAFSSMPNLSVFADAAFGDDDFWKVEAGLSIHLGTNGASLIDRQRRYDPDVAIFNQYGG